jgi:type IV pilus assembly protein PilX
MKKVSNRQAGVALLITLIVLLMVSVMGLAALRMSLSQSKISLNTRLDAMSFQAAESGIRGVLLEATESNIASSTNVIGATLALGVCTDKNSTATTCVVYRCVTQANPTVAGACSATDFLDGTGSSRAESRTRHTGQFHVVNSSIALYQDYVFESVSRGCLLESGACNSVYWSENVQEFKKMAPADLAANYD